VDAFDDRLRAGFGLIAFAVNRHVLHHMRRLGSEFGMDFETAYVLGTLAQLNVAPGLYPGAEPSAVLRSDGLVAGHTVPVRLAQLCAVTGLPRESVRRRLLALQGQGKVQRTPHGLWVATERCADEQAFEFTRETVRSLLGTAACVRELLEPAAR